MSIPLDARSEAPTPCRVLCPLLSAVRARLPPHPNSSPFALFRCPFAFVRSHANFLFVPLQGTRLEKGACLYSTWGAEHSWDPFPSRPPCRGMLAKVVQRAKGE
ncbi:hypothetical protein LIA77_03166 [Sarocladium implicatum]|nr:hypothetical protein LIA77_03166 [Sarocladium implicatum]